MFEHWWSHAEAHYVGLQNGKLSDTLTLYYDPILSYDHRRGPESALMMAVYLAPQKPRGRGVDFRRWRRTPRLDDRRPAARAERQSPFSPCGASFWPASLATTPSTTGSTPTAKRTTNPPGSQPPASSPGASDSTSPTPRGQFNATRMMAEGPCPEGAWRRLFNAPNLRKVSEPTVYGVDFPTVCLSQACYDAARGRLVIATDAGIPDAAGQPTSFRVTNLDSPLRAESKSTVVRPATGASLRVMWRSPPPLRSTSSWSRMRPVALRRPDEPQA